MRFSASRIKAWMECSLQAHYRYDLGLPRRQSAKASFGSVIHHALKTYNDTGNYDRAVAEFRDLWENPEKIGVTPDYWPKFNNYLGLRKKGLEILADFHTKQRFQDRTVIGTEIPFLVPFGEHELHGFIDCVDIKRSGTGVELLRVLDWKGATKEPSRTALALDVQFSIYDYAVGRQEFWVGVDGNPDFPGVANGQWLWETVGSQMTRRAIWYHLWNQKELDAGPRTQVDYERLYRVCEEIKRANETQVFVPTIGQPCTWCDHVDECAMEIPVTLAAASNPDDATRWI